MARRAAWLLVGLALVAACGNGSSQSSKPGPATLVYAVDGVPTSLDNAPYQGDPTRYVRYPMDSSLVIYDPALLQKSGCTSSLAPVDALAGGLAKSWTTSQDGKTITFTLKDAVSAVGNKLTTQDVKWSFDRMIALSPLVKYQFFQVATYAANPVTIVDDKTFQLHLAQPNPLALVVLTIMLETILDSTEVKQHATADDPWATKWMATHTADFGPWKLESFDPGSKVVFTSNPNYKGTRGNINRLIIENVPDGATRAELLRAGSIDWAGRLPFNQFKSIQGASGVKTQLCLSPNRDDLLLQEKDPALADVRVRQAISMGIDRQALVQGAYLGVGKPALSGVSQFYKFPTPSAQYSYDANQAKSLLAQAGYANGLTLTLTYSTTRPGPWAEQVAVLLQSMLSKVGITLQLNNVASATQFSDLFAKGNYQVLLFSEPPVFPDPGYSASTYSLSTNTAQDTFHFKDPNYDALVLQALHMPLGPERDAVVSKIAALGVTDYAVIYLVDEEYLFTYRSNITGFIPEPFGDILPQQFVKS